MKLSIEFPENELVSFSDEILDTTSTASLKKFEHNLKILIKRAKQAGKIDKFVLIRQDDFFPTDWEWRVLSKNTNLEKECTLLSYELKKAYALEQIGINPYMEIMGIKVPNISDEQITQALSQIDKTLGSVLLPSRFRSTKHFTVNTPLGVTGDYNTFVKTNRNYIIMDDISTFLKSPYAYSVSYHDAYLDISHESLPISKDAVVLINDEKYKKIMSNEKVANELAQKRIIRFKGDENKAINMILTEMGALPSKNAYYDNEIYDILDTSMRKLAEENNLFFDKNHGGELKLGNGHFSNYYDEKNQDYEEALKEFISFLRRRFPQQQDLFPEHLTFTQSNCMEIVQTLGTANLLEAINEYNESASNRVIQTLKEYKQDRKNITPEIHQQFVQTIALINDFYKNNTDFETDETRVQTEEAIQRFLQGETVSEQLEAAREVWQLLPQIAETTIQAGTINLEEFVVTAIHQGISREDVENSKAEEYKRRNINIEKQREGGEN